MRRGIYGDQTGPRTGTWARHIGEAELYALAIGQVIGAGVITLVVPAIKMTGYSAWLAYFAAIIMGFFMILPTVFVSSTVRLGGGNYSMLAGLAGPNISGIYAFMYLTQCLSLSLFGSSAARISGRHHSRAQQSWRPHRNRSGAADLLLCNQPDGH